MELKTVLYTKENGIGIITLNRPKIMNALDDTFFIEISKIMDEIVADHEVKAVILTGQEKVFAAGGDIAFMSKANALQAQNFVDLITPALLKIEDSPKPVIAAISGMALGGGCELALACDIRIAAEGTIFGQPEINLGIIPGAGGTQRLTRTVGPGWAKYMILSGLTIDSDTALKIGLVTAVVPKDKLLDEAKKLARALGSKSPIALRAAKDSINRGINVDLSSGLEYEKKTFTILFSTEDQKEGMQAFLEKRKPNYTGR
ncbi:MAG: enoyl-CoA hydratase-related protein [Syntrophomonas sp.]